MKDRAHATGYGDRPPRSDAMAQITRRARERHGTADGVQATTGRGHDFIMS
jgi:hypothetical protein